MSPGAAIRLDAAAAIAASKCWLNRAMQSGELGDAGARIRASHHGPCGWCDYPARILAEAIADFWTRAAETGEDLAFERLPDHEQRRRVLMAQGYLELLDT